MRAGAVLLGAAVFAWLSAIPGWAADEPSPRVGRVSVVAGPVQYRAPAGEWADALINEPIAAGAGLRTEPEAEAGWRGAGARVALAPESEARVLRLDRDVLQIALAGGRIGVHLAAGGASPKTVEIDLPQGGAWLAAPGDYDITAGDSHAPAQIQVFAGKARVGGGLDESRIAAATPDWFSDWWRSQDDNADRSDPRAWPGVAGIVALNEAGRWERDATFGNVWYPSDLAADWTPYRDGVWRFLPPWGWTWIPAEPWGFAPAHYGRWARIDQRWGWVPGGDLAAADYSPAEVAFLGTAGIGLSRPGDIGASPAVAWFPLAPGERMGAGADADGRYKNRRFATAVPRAVFAGGLPVAPALVDDVPVRRLADAPVILQALGITPAGPAVPAAAAKPVAARRVKPVVASAATPPANAAAASDERHAYVVALRDPPPPPARPPTRDTRRRAHVAAAATLRTRPLSGTPRSPHNRQHLAAARGGA